MAITLMQRMTRFMRRNNGICPQEWREHYRAWRQGSETAALELLARCETDEDRETDAADRHWAEAMHMDRQPVNFAVSQPKASRDEHPDVGPLEGNPKKAVRRNRTAPPAADAGTGAGATGD